jgi:hypothetical protein
MNLVLQQPFELATDDGSSCHFRDREFSVGWRICARQPEVHGVLIGYGAWPCFLGPRMLPANPAQQEEPGGIFGGIY